ncbi:MAG TPA: NAD(P)H-binding protein [Candidatus Dormibacteraeota bacterium]|jgi:uncharacterized protein YbjT (DUF2867 family)|nr:NAD(P)H-binding protein [Candidatus Dormibacteraeota bacterium]
MTSPVLVTGGTGRLGRRVVARLVDAGCEVRVLARHRRDTPGRVAFFIGDLRRGVGVEPAVTGVRAIVHCATSTRGDAEAARNLVVAARRTGSAHLLHPSIVGIDKMASWGYTKAKVQAEQIVEESGLPWTILRVTQFYDYCLGNSRTLSRFPVVAPVPAGFRVQPVDPDEVAARLVELALGDPAGRAPDMAGPQVSSWVDLFRSYLTATHRRRWVVPIWVPGSRAVRNGALLPSSPHIVGTRTWDEFLTARLGEGSTSRAS